MKEKIAKLEETKKLLSDLVDKIYREGHDDAMRYVNRRLDKSLNLVGVGDDEDDDDGHDFSGYRPPERKKKVRR